MKAAALSWNGGAPHGARWPAPLKPGDSIGLFAPAHCFDQGEAERGAELLRSWGFQVKIPRGIFKKRKYLAGSDEERLAVMDELMGDDSVAALMAVRGGFGCQRLLPALRERWLEWPAKAIVGFSDLTALHLARFAASGVIGYHAPMAVSLGKADPAQAADRLSTGDLKKALSANPPTGRWNFAAKDVLSPPPSQVRGPLLGGNLTLVTALLSGPWQPAWDGAILMLEEVGEAGYKLDRLLTTLRHSPAWHKAAALVFGHFTGCGPARELRALITEAARDFHGPVLINAPFGHEPRNRFFPVGALALLEIF